MSTSPVRMVQLGGGEMSVTLNISKNHSKRETKQCFFFFTFFFPYIFEFVDILLIQCGCLRDSIFHFF